MSDPFGPSSSVADSVTTRPADTRTFGSSDTFSQDCVDGVGGTPWTAEQLNEIVANLRALLRVNGNLVAGAPVVAENHADTMLALGAQYLVQRGQTEWALDTGSADALVLNPTPAWQEYKPGARARVAKAASANATATPTATVSGLGAKTILRADGSPIQPGDLPGYGLFDLEVDASLNLRLLALPPAAVRLRLSANTTFYVATTGSDATGSGASGAPWATLQHAYNQIQSLYDLNGFLATVSVADGTYAAGVIASGALVGQNGAIASGAGGNIEFTGSANAVISLASGQPAFAANPGAFLSVSGFTVEAAGGQTGCNGYLTNFGGGLVVNNPTFGAMPGGAHFYCAGGNIAVLGETTIDGGADYHVLSFQSGATFAWESGASIALSGTPAFTDFVNANMLGLIYGAPTITGSATGARYSATTNGVIETYGGGASFFPGNASGATASGGEYV